MTYDGAGNVSTKTDGEGNTTTYQYNEFNKLSKVMNALNEESVYRYDNNANLISQMDGKGNTAFYEYNARNLLVKRIDAGGRTGTEGSYVYNEEKMERYTYHPNELIKEKIDRNGVTTSYTYDVHGRLLTQTAGSLTVANTYDNNGNKLTSQTVR